MVTICMWDIWSWGMVNRAGSAPAFAEVYDVIFSADSRPAEVQPESANAAAVSERARVIERGVLMSFFLFMAVTSCRRPHAAARQRACRRRAAGGRPAPCRGNCAPHRGSRGGSLRHAGKRIG